MSLPFLHPQVGAVFVIITGCGSSREGYARYHVLGPLHDGVPSHMAFSGWHCCVRLGDRLPNRAYPGRENLRRRRLPHGSSVVVDPRFVRVRWKRRLEQI